MHSISFSRLSLSRLSLNAALALSFVPSKEICPSPTMPREAQSLTTSTNKSGRIAACWVQKRQMVRKLGACNPERNMKAVAVFSWVRETNLGCPSPHWQYAHRDPLGQTHPTKEGVQNSGLACIPWIALSGGLQQKGIFVEDYILLCYNGATKQGLFGQPEIVCCYSWTVGDNKCQSRKAWFSGNYLIILPDYSKV